MAEIVREARQQQQNEQQVDLSSLKKKSYQRKPIINFKNAGNIVENLNLSNEKKHPALKES